MKHYLSLLKSAKDDEPPNKNKVRGDVRGGGYLKRIVTGTDKDGSPQYRYIRSQSELKAWQERQRKNKPKDKEPKKEGLKEKVDKEHSESAEASRSHSKDKDKKEDKDKKPVRKALVLFLNAK